MTLWSHPSDEWKLQTTGKMLLLCPSLGYPRWQMPEMPGQPAPPQHPPPRTTEHILLKAISKHMRNKRVTRNHRYGFTTAHHLRSIRLPHKTGGLRKLMLDNQSKDGQKLPALRAAINGSITSCQPVMGRAAHGSILG